MAYKDVILNKLNPYVDNMDKHIEHDKGLLLLLVAFLDSTEKVITKLNITDNSMLLLKSKLSKFVPIFLEHIEKLLEDWLIGIRKQFIQDHDKIVSVRESNLGMNRISDVNNLYTAMPNDIFTFIQKQFDLISERLSGSHLFEVLKSTISRFNWIMNNLSEKAEKNITEIIQRGPIDNSIGFESILIYFNDFSEIINMYEDYFQDYVLQKVIATEEDEESKTPVKERANTILYSTYREILQSRQEMVRRL